MGRAVIIGGNGNLYTLYQIRTGKVVGRGNNSSRGR